MSLFKKRFQHRWILGSIQEHLFRKTAPDNLFSLLELLKVINKTISLTQTKIWLSKHKEREIWANLWSLLEDTSIKEEELLRFWSVSLLHARHCFRWIWYQLLGSYLFIPSLLKLSNFSFLSPCKHRKILPFSDIFRGIKREHLEEMSCIA